MSGSKSQLAESTAAHRHWLAPDQPCLPQAASWLMDADFTPSIDSIGKGLGAHVCDLRNVVCVTPGSRSNHLLVQCLLDHGHARNKRLLPPRVITPGEMVDVLLIDPTPTPRATPTERLHAWMAALQRVHRHTLEPLLRHVSSLDDPLARDYLARTLDGLHDELAGERLTFANVAQTTESMERFAEADRWRAMHAVHEQYLLVLEETGLRDPHAAREAALRESNPRETHCVLIGVVDLNAQQRVVIDALSDRAHALIHADESQSHLFDGYGCVNAEAWRAETIAIDAERIVVADRPPDQAQAVLRRLAGYNGRYATDAVTIGLGHESLAEPIKLASQWVELDMRHAGGEAMSRTRPFRLLEALADWMRDETFAHFATLGRHVDLERWLNKDLQSTLGDTTQAIENWMTLLDEYYSAHLQSRLTGNWLAHEKNTRPLAAVWDAVQRLCEPLQGDARPVGAWASRILELLQRIYVHVKDDHRGDATRLAEALRTIRDTLSAWHDMPDALQPRVDATIALRLLLHELAGRRLPAAVRRDQVEMLGWLELHLDTAPALIVTGFNDGDIPSAVHGDAFLPNTLRERLGVLNNTRRYARDAYLLDVMLKSREDVTLITGRRRADDEPATPSRLLFACDDETVLERIKRVCGDDVTHTDPTMIGWARPAETSRFVVPPLPSDIAPPDSMNVTDFKLYLQCPYRYALTRLLRLEPVDDAADEMDPLVFGSLAHKALEQFGRDTSINASDDAQAIEQHLFEVLDDLADTWFGNDPLTAVHVQLDALKQRLRGFSRWQAQTRRDGWAIEHCEWKLNGAPLDVPGEEPMPVHAKIDRVDVHEQTGDVRIIDYKTGDRARVPCEAHHGRKTLPKDGTLQWQDLQLPLYHHLYYQQNMNQTGSITTGFLVLPRNAHEIDFKKGPWDAAQIEQGVDAAREIVRAIRRRAFAMNPDYDDSFDRFARICQTTTLAGADDEGDAGAGEPL